MKISDLLGREAGTWESQTFRHVDMLGKAVSQPATYGMAGREADLRRQDNPRQAQQEGQAWEAGQGRYAFQGRQAG